MTEKIRFAEPAGKLIRDTSPALPLVSPEMIAAALGAEPTTTVSRALSPLTLFAVRSELFRRLQSNGGRPGLSDTSRRTKIPLGDGDWAELEKLAAALSGPDGSPSAGQIGSVLLSMAIRSVTADIAKMPDAVSSIARELSAQSGK